MFMFDIETLSVESTAVVLSAACVHFDPTADTDYALLANNACFVKFNAKEQAETLHRAIDKPTLDWWANRSEDAKRVSLIPRKDDLSAMDGLVKLASYVQANGGSNQIVWTRGSLDQMAMESLSRSLSRHPVFPYNMFRDVRTYVDLTYGSTNGYVEFKDKHNTLTQDRIIKHNPVWDCVLDIAMMLDGIAV